MRVLVLAASTAVFGSAFAADIYRWVDDQGRAQISDRPPGKPSRNVTRQDSRVHEIDPEHQREAVQRAAKNQARLKALEEDRAKAQQAAALKAPASRPAPEGEPRDTTGCQARWAAYRSSQACYAPFITARGGMKVEAFAHCGPALPDPSYQCGPGPQETPR